MPSVGCGPAKVGNAGEAVLDGVFPKLAVGRGRVAVGRADGFLSVDVLEFLPSCSWPFRVG